MELHQPPTIIDKAKGFGTAMVNWATQDGFSHVTDEQFAQRKAICTACQFWIPEKFNGMGLCKLCGCTGMKLYIPSSICPNHPPKWNPIFSGGRPSNPA